MSKISSLFNRPEIHPLVLDVGLVEIFGPEWITWDGDSVAMAAARQSGGSVSRATQSKINGLLVLHGTHGYWEDWRAFEDVSWGLSGHQVDLAQLTPLTAVVLLYGYRTAKWIDSKSEFSDDVIAYILVVMLSEQFSLLPTDLGFLQSRFLEANPLASNRAELVKAGLIAGIKTPASNTEENAISVELLRHSNLETVLASSCSIEIITQQADAFGLGRTVRAVLEV